MKTISTTESQEEMMKLIFSAYDNLKAKYGSQYSEIFRAEEQVAEIEKIRDFELTEGMKHGNQ